MRKAESAYLRAEVLPVPGEPNRKLIFLTVADIFSLKHEFKQDLRLSTMEAISFPLNYNNASPSSCVKNLRRKLGECIRTLV